jgi:GNAT superfamily N-acetyltransferase
MSTASLFPPRPARTLAGLTTRPGTVHDLVQVTAMHRRCSGDSIYRRFHVPMPRVGARVLRSLLAPTDGWSMVAERDGTLVALACAAPVSPTDLEVGLLVEDAEQGQGIGARMLGEVATDAPVRGYRRLHCVTQTGNDRVLGTVRAAGLIARLSAYDGLLHVEVPLSRLGAQPVTQPVTRPVTPPVTRPVTQPLNLRD